MSRGVSVPQAEILFFGDFIPGQRFINTRGILDYYGYFYSGGRERYRDSTYADFFSQESHAVLAPHHGLSAVPELTYSIIPQLGVIFNSYAITLTAKFNSTLAAIADPTQVRSMFLYSFQYEISKLSINYQIGLQLKTTVIGTSTIEFVVINRIVSPPTISVLFSTSISVGKSSLK